MDGWVGGAGGIALRCPREAAAGGGPERPHNAVALAWGLRPSCGMAGGPAERERREVCAVSAADGCARHTLRSRHARIAPDGGNDRAPTTPILLQP